jgi:hypothetical protein
LPNVPNIGTYYVFKRGLTTNITLGNLIEYCPYEKVYKVKASAGQAAFGAPGALVFLVSRNESSRAMQLFPIGLLYGGTDEWVSVLPLTNIFKDFCAKQKINQLKVEFLNPKMSGVFTFNCNLQQYLLLFEMIRFCLLQRRRFLI